MKYTSGIPRSLSVLRSPLWFATLMGASVLMATSALSQAKTMSDYTVTPSSLDPGVAPLVMLAMSNDHQLYYKAYTDYDDLNGVDGLEEIETGYNNSQPYVGYFESDYCYSYAGGLFSIDKKSTGEHYCNEGAGQLWSGNFLNWATMTRIDILRKILYGGKRVAQAVDSTDLAVLERSYLPNDAHSFTKYYNGDDLDKLTPFGNNALAPLQRDRGLTLCNTTKHDTINNRSVNNTNPPLMRAIQGNHSLWAAGERFQCVKIGTPEKPADAGEVPANSPAYGSENGKTKKNEEGTGSIVIPEERLNVGALLAERGFYPHLTVPNTASTLTYPVTDYVVRVAACPTKYASDLSTSCKAYPNAQKTTANPYRPTGLLQEYGSNEDLKWGLISGSYDRNKSGGYLRKQASFITDEIDADTGNFTAVKGIINNIDAFRIATWYWGAGPDNGGAGYFRNGVSTNCPWGMADFTSGTCNDWGNPLGEVMYEAYRYLAGQAAPQFNVENNTRVMEEDIAPTGVTIAPWNIPLNQDNACANLSVIGINTSAQSYDNDEIAQLGNIVGLGEAKTLSSYFDQISLSDVSRWLVGSNGIGSDNQCTTKTVTSLQGLTGVCPEAPRLKGSWDIAAVAKHVHDTDINTTLGKKQYINTYGVSLSTALPSISIDVPGSTDKKVTLVPACNTRVNGNDAGNCALVNFKVLFKNSEPDANGFVSGSFYVNWEDSEQGGDYDQDLHGIIDYKVGAGVNTEGVEGAEGADVKITSRIIGQSTAKQMAFGFVITGVDEPGLKVLSGIEGYPSAPCPGGACNRNDIPGVDFYTSTTNVVDFLKPPLYFAAKNGNDKPEKSYFNSNNPAQLQKDLKEVFGGMGPTPAKGGSEVASTSTNAGANLFLHSFYYSQLEATVDGVAQKVNWIGQVGALFIDEHNRMREDTNKNSQLDAGDYVITFDSTAHDALGQPLVIKTRLPDEVNGAPVVINAAASYSDINYLWTTTGALGNATPAGRILKTVIPSSFAEGVDVVKGNLQNFDADLFAGTGTANLPLLGGYSAPQKLIDFVRGNEVVGLRSRSLDGKKYLLGDITDTSPLILSTPSASFDTELSDVDYTAYKNAKAAQPIVVYTATNNGMIQAFNAGTYNKASKTYSGTPVRPLGKELWGYIPFNLLPHLQWLADPAYQHVPYFNGFMRAYDVKSFKGATANSNGHIKGWGTILVVGTGIGGASFPITTTANATEPDFYTRPAYIILDISDRMEPPKLIAEIAHDELGFTTGEPDVVRYETADKEGWFLVFGSGPRASSDNARRDAQIKYAIANDVSVTDTSAKQARMFAFNLSTATLQTPVVVDESEENAFVGGINGMDWNRDFLDDAIYFGTVAGTVAEPDGRLIRGRLSYDGTALSFEFSTLFDMNKPVTARPTTVLDYQGERWVFAGSGRFYTRQDASALPPTANQFVGIMEAGLATGDTHVSGVGTTTFTAAQLYDSTAITAYANGDIKDATPNTLTTVDALRDYIHSHKDTGSTTPKFKGWRRDFSNNALTGVDERQHSEATYMAGTLLLGTSDPGDYNSCNSGDRGYIYLIDMLSGIPSRYSSNTEEVVDPLNNAGATLTQIVPSMAVDSAIFQKLDGYTTKISLGDGSFGEGPKLNVTIESKRQSWREVPITW